MTAIEVYALELLAKKYEEHQREYSRRADACRAEKLAMLIEGGEDSSDLRDGMSVNDYENLVDEVGWARGCASISGSAVNDLKDLIKAAKAQQ